MSSISLNRAEIEKRRLEELERQKQARIEAIAKAKAEAKKEAEKYRKDALKFITKIQNTTVNNDVDADMMLSLSRIKNEYSQQVNDIIASPILSTEADDIKREASSIYNNALDTYREFEVTIDKLKKKFLTYASHEKFAKELTQTKSSESLSISDYEEILPIAKVFKEEENSNEVFERCKTLVTQKKTNKIRLLKEISSLVNNTYISDSHRRMLFNIVTNITNDDDMRLPSLESEFNSVKGIILTEFEKRKAAYKIYDNYYTLLKNTLKKAGYTKSHFPRSIASFKDINEINEEIRLIDEEIMRLEKRLYINDAVNKALKKLGCNVEKIANDSNVLPEFETTVYKASEQAALAVSHSHENDAIRMEIIGIRDGQSTEEIFSTETKLCEKQKELIKLLHDEYGINFTNVITKPAKASYDKLLSDLKPSDASVRIENNNLKQIINLEKPSALEMKMTL